MIELGKVGKFFRAKVFAILMSLVFFSGIVHAAATWEAEYGFVPPNRYFMAETTDGGVVHVGSMSSSGGSLVSIMKHNALGNVEWSRTYKSLHQTSFSATKDGGFILGANGYHGPAIVKLDSVGNIVWGKYYRLPLSDKYDPRYYKRNQKAISVVESKDGGFFFLLRDNIGTSYKRVELNSWMVKIDPNGNVEWQKLLRNTDPYALWKTSDGGYAVEIVWGDFGFIKLNGQGEIQWSKAYRGGGSLDYLRSLVELEDGGYGFAGETLLSGWQAYIPWMMKVDKNGDILWQKRYWIGTRNIVAAAKVSDGGFVLAGSDTHSDSVLLKTDSSGESEWIADMGAGIFHGLRTGSFLQTSDGGYELSRVDTETFRGAPLKLFKLGATLNKCSGDLKKSYVSTSENTFIASELNLMLVDPQSTPVVFNMNDLVQVVWAHKEKILCVSALPEIFVDSTAVNYGFGTAEIGQTEKETLLIANDGSVDLDIRDLAITGADADQFSLSSDCSTVIPGTSCTIDVTFAPTSLGEKNAILKIVSNDPTQPVIEVPLSGEGVDTKPPVVSIATDWALLWPPNHKLIDVLVDGTAADDGSGIASVDITVADEYGKYDATVPGFGNAVALEAWRDGSDKDGRVYTLTAVATDKAGNTSTATTRVLVPHDMRK